MQKLNILAYMSYLLISFNDTLTNDIVSFEELGPAHLILDSTRI